MAATIAKNRPLVREALKEGWNFTRTHYWKMWGVFMIFMLITGAGTLIPYALAGAGVQFAFETDLPLAMKQIVNFLASVAYFAPIFLVDFALYAGLFSAVKNGVEGKPFGLGNLFDGFRKGYKKTLLLSFAVLGFFLTLLVVVFGVLGGLQSFMARAAAGGFVPFFGNLIPLYYVVAIALVFGSQAFLTYQFLLMWEDGLTVKEILVESFRLGRKYYKPTLLYVLAFLGMLAVVIAAVAVVMGIFAILNFIVIRPDSPVIMIAGGCVVFAGMIFLLPAFGSWSYATCACLYRKIRTLEK